MNTNNLKNDEKLLISNINVNCHSSIQIFDMFFDPYNISDKNKKAKYIFLTHTHYDHLSVGDIEKIIAPSTIIIATQDAKEKLEKFNNKIIFVKPNMSFIIDDIKIETFNSYNINKNFHKKEENWVGYKITKNDITYVIIGDSDLTPEIKSLKCNVLFVPIGGTYTMDYGEAAKLTNIINPNFVIPTHYGSVVGSINDSINFQKLINDDISIKIFF